MLARMREIEELVRMKDEEVDEEESRRLDQLYLNDKSYSEGWSEDSHGGHVQSSARELTEAPRLHRRSDILSPEKAASHPNQM